jgi:hypothetical protein
MFEKDPDQKLKTKKLGWGKICMENRYRPFEISLFFFKLSANFPRPKKKKFNEFEPR